MSDQIFSACMFVNFDQALGFGHIAWGFEVEPGRFFYGSTDHLLRRPMWDVIALVKYARVEAGGDIDYWSAEGSHEEMLSEMCVGPHIRYHAYKQLAVARPDSSPGKAKAAAEKLRGGGWCLFDNNCVHQTHRILEIFGAGALLPKPALALSPVRFFANSPGHARPLGQRPGTSNCAIRSCL